MRNKFAALQLPQPLVRFSTLGTLLTGGTISASPAHEFSDSMPLLLLGS